MNIPMAWALAVHQIKNVNSISELLDSQYFKHTRLVSGQYGLAALFTAINGDKLLNHFLSKYSGAPHLCYSAVVLPKVKREAQDDF